MTELHGHVVNLVEGKEFAGISSFGQIRQELGLTNPTGGGLLMTLSQQAIDALRNWNEQKH
jgi:hypothetical protein